MISARKMLMLHAEHTHVINCTVALYIYPIGNLLNLLSCTCEVQCLEIFGGGSLIPLYPLVTPWSSPSSGEMSEVSLIQFPANLERTVDTHVPRRPGKKGNGEKMKRTKEKWNTTGKENGTRCRAVTLPRRETSWNLQGCPKLVNRSQPLVGRSSPHCGDMWRTYCCVTVFFLIVDMCLSCEDIARQSCAMVPSWRFLATFCILCFQRAACSRFQTCILNSH